MTHEEKLPKNQLDLERLMKPDSNGLGSMVAGLSGSGKTKAVLHALQEASKGNRWGKKHRFVIIDPKVQGGDYDILSDPFVDVMPALKNMEKERITVFWPDMEFLDEQISAVIDHMFYLSERDPESSFTFVLDEAATVISGNKVPLSIKRVAVQGRSKRIKPIFVSQRPILNRWTDGNLSNLILFRVLPMDADLLSKRWGADFQAIDATIKGRPYSFAWFDLESGDLNFMAPVPLPKPKRKPKKRSFIRLPKGWR